MSHIEVFYIGGSTGWAAAQFDAEGNQIGAADFDFQKADAVRNGRTWANSLNCDLHVFTKGGSRKVIPAHQV